MCAAISREELAGNSMLMLFAGYDTTASAMQFLAYNLAVHKECQEKLRQEIKDTVDKYVSLVSSSSSLLFIFKRAAVETTEVLSIF